MIQFETILRKTDGELWQYFFLVPDSVSTLLIENQNRRVICRIDDVVYHCALLPNGRNEYLVLLNKERRKK